MDQLMTSIIPRYLIEKVVRNYIEKEINYAKTKKIATKNPFKEAATLLDEHDNVTILFADIVHYTEMTQKLSITDLLETLNDLFGTFDELSEELKVTRIKFLGDCYYCVSGLPPDPAANHAEACVDLGLAMISVIANVRRKRNININMRIGVHSGKITCGIIGSVKYQFDIWSQDVDIANKMESEGCPGKVHITNKTKELLNKLYNINITDKGETVPQFKSNGLQTFLISPHSEIKHSLSVENMQSEQASPRLSIYKKQRSVPIELDRHSFLLKRRPPNGTLRRESIEEADEDIEDRRSHSLTIIERNNLDGNIPNIVDLVDEKVYTKRYSNNPTRWSRVSERNAVYGVKRRTAFMNNNIKRYSERTEAINKDMETTINNMSFSKYSQFFRIKEINSILLIYKDNNTEFEYIKLSDPLFKYYLVAVVVLIFGVYIIQNVSLMAWDVATWPFIAIAIIILIVFLPLSWTHFVWNRYVSNLLESPPDNCLIIFLCKSSKYITKSFTLRLFIYTLIYVIFCGCVLLELIECSVELQDKKNITTRLFTLLIENSNRNIPGMQCAIPWHLTEICVLSVTMTFIFLRMFMWIKFCFSIIIFSVFTYSILQFGEEYYKDSEPFNMILDPRMSHILTIVYVTLTLHLIDRQTDYMNRLDFLVNKKVRTEQDDANALKIINKHLLNNILPEHVANIYLDIEREMNDLYYEEHEEVAVMFASLILGEELLKLPEKRFLAVMNEYISIFDTLTNRKEFANIEKIKIAKWTYMAACGLKDKEIEKHSSCSSLEVLLSFASEMYKALERVNKMNMQSTELRIGISMGHILAGVVGSKKPLYDIWGDPVNMASRMDSTGVPSRIQVMENTAEIIQNLGIQCECRGEIMVKGKGVVKTYFVKLDENHNLLRRTNNSDE